MTLVIFLSALLSPLMSAVFSLFQKRWTVYFSTFALFITAVCFLYLLFQKFELTWSVPWFSIGLHSISANVLLNPTTLMMSALIAVLSLLIHIYSLDYLKDDERIISFFGNLGLFTFSMLGLAVSQNLLLTFCWWELVGFSSYCLIGHWRTKPQAAYAATQSFLINRLADVGFVIALALLWKDNGSLDYSILLERPQSATAFTLLFIGLMGKSAQLPFSGWLLNAMEGPTPASALIHSATMVAAGVYLLVMLNHCIPSDVITGIHWVGTATCFLAAIGAWLSFDIKRILAYSTISQLGFMMIALVIDSKENVAFVHLIIHAFIKAGLFLAAGLLIKLYSKDTLNHTQDIRHMGNLFKASPLLCLGIIVCLASLMGIPLTAGFASKEIILASLWLEHSAPWQSFLAWVNIIAIIITSLYCMRLAFYLTNNTKGGFANALSRVYSSIPFFATIILSYLAIFYLNLGFLHPFSTEAMGILVVYVIVGAVTYLCLFKTRRIDHFKNPDFIFEKLYSTVVIPTHFIAARTLSIDRLIDKLIHLSVYMTTAFASLIGWFDKNGVDGLVTLFAKTISGFGQLIRAALKGQVQSYLAWSIAFILLLIILCTIFV